MKRELSLTQKQKLTLSPQLYQSINILQLNLIELKPYTERLRRILPLAIVIKVGLHIY